jgi:hypothetical protein
VQDVAGTDYDVRSPVALSGDPRDLPKDMQGVVLERAPNIQYIWLIHNVCEYSQVSKYSQGLVQNLAEVEVGRRLA